MVIFNQYLLFLNKILSMRLFIQSLVLFLFTTSITAQSKDLKLKKGLYANIETAKGDIFLQLYPEKAPLTVANFVGLAEGKLTVFDSIEHKEPFYDGLIFHRVVPNFVIQGGDPEGNGNGNPGYQFFNETDTSLTHEKGVLAMANAGPNTNGCQFYITLAPAHHLDGGYSIFGRVLEGQDVVDNIAKGDTIRHIEIVKKGLKYKWFYNPTKEFKKAYDRLKKIHDAEELKMKKAQALEKVRLVEAKSKSEEEYKSYFYNLIKKKEPEAVQTASGLVYVVRKKGEGEVPKKGDDVSLHYTGLFLYGGKFDSSYDRKKPLDFKYMVMGLIPGFNEGVGLSNEGEEVDLFIPYYLAYGKNGRPPQIPAYADLIFKIKILDIENAQENN